MLSSIKTLRQTAAPRGWAPSWSDGILALLLVAPTLLTRRYDTLETVLSIGMVLPLLWRRQAPVAVFAVIWCAAAFDGLFGNPTFSDSALLVAFYTVAATQSRRTTAIVALAVLIGIVCAAVKFGPSGGGTVEAFVGLSGLATAAGALGINVGHRRQLLAGLRERADRLEQDRERDVALARVTERSRIAREMHDVVAHNLSVMLALCDGAAYHVHDAPERVESALEQASRTGRQALAEMRQLLGVLRESPAGPELAPQPGVRQIEELVDQLRGAGLPVSYTMTGQLDDAPPGMELTIYRIVQEALTNTLKHAGPGATARVSLRAGEHAIELEVRDSGSSRRPPGSGGGAGLRGMRERAAVYGGELEAGPCPEGGWQVRTALVIPATVATPAR